MGLTAELSTFVSDTRYSDLPEDVVEHARCFLYETVAASLLGSGTQLAQQFVALLDIDGEPPVAPLVGMGRRASLDSATFFNTAIVDCTDSVGGTFHGVVHPGKNVVPAAITTAAALGTSGEALIEAIVTAVEAYTRIDILMGLPHGARGHYSDGTVGSLGAAFAVAKLHQLDASQLESALGIAAMLTPATMGGQGMFRSAGRPLTMGRGAANALIAVRAVMNGVDGPPGILEMNDGFCSALSGIDASDSSADDLGTAWESRSFYHKPIVGCRLTHAAQLGALELKEEHGFTVDEIDVVTVGVPAEPNMRVISHHADLDGNIVDHSCSAPYLVASVMQHDDLSPASLGEDRMADPALHQLAERIQVVADEEMTNRGEITKHELSGVRLAIQLVDGTRHTYAADSVLGDPEDGLRMNSTDLIRLLITYSETILPLATVEVVIETIRHLERVDDVSMLTDLLCGAEAVSAP